MAPDAREYQLPFGAERPSYQEEWLVAKGELTMYTEKDKNLINKAADCADLLSADLQAMVSADDLLLGEITLALMNDARILNNKLERIRYLVTSTAEGNPA
ncbi:At2g43970/F6E13.10 (modular protein) [Acidithiobacillus ferrivorans]|uniref:At2g43970/F6E13.10 (Modular protein) n=2 Tax=Acidithiobacillus ferrivorans TaxID=160808 RepID=A0A060UV88_9PROT|nr:At2g43970/F6E13.10 (modular protein) [Acidithiobacillus ferrivorans]